MIQSISSSLIKAYVTMKSDPNRTQEEMFKSISLEMGGDGNTITKKQLEYYIKKLESTKNKANKKKIEALNKILENWDTITDGEDVITSANTKAFLMLMLATYADTETEQETDEPKESMEEYIYNYIEEMLGLANKDEIKITDLTSYRNELISNPDKDEDWNNELISSLTNMIESYSSTTTIETEA